MPARKKKAAAGKKTAVKKKTGPARKAKKPAPRKAAAKKSAPKKAAVKAPVAGAKESKSRRRGAPKPPVLPWRQALPGETKLGVVDDYFTHIGVISLRLEKPLTAGDKIHVRGHTTDFTEPVDSMQIEHQTVSSAKAGDAVGIKVIGRCRKGDYVYRAAAQAGSTAPAALPATPPL